MSFFIPYPYKFFPTFNKFYKKTFKKSSVKMVRSPCCESMGLKKGPWTHEEDQILVNYIRMYGHGNWRALPKLAGLLRCGKSCRLRWTNYLNPDIKRGNFSREEEQTIIQLHSAMGNRWSAIAARLPGRTDNEIKNVWHTHLKKRVHDSENKCRNFQEQKLKHEDEAELSHSTSSSSKPSESNSARHCYSEISSVIGIDEGEKAQVLGNLQEMDNEFWSEVFSGENSGELIEASYKYTSLSSMNDDDMQFWFNVFTRGEEFTNQ